MLELIAVVWNIAICWLLPAEKMGNTAGLSGLFIAAGQYRLLMQVDDVIVNFFLTLILNICSLNPEKYNSGLI